MDWLDLLAEGYEGSNKSPKLKSPVPTMPGKTGLPLQDPKLGLGPPILPSILAYPLPYAPRGADVLSPTLWTQENWTCQKQRLKSTSA